MTSLLRSFGSICIDNRSLGQERERFGAVMNEEDMEEY